MRWQSQAVWEERLAQCGTIFETSARLPDAVHRLRLAPLPIFDGDVIFGSEAWPMLSALARLHGDEEVNFLTLEPMPEEYLTSSGGYGGFTINALAPRESFRSELYGATLVGSPGTLGYTAQVAAVFGGSLSWGIWCERNIAGLMTGVDPSLLGEWQMEYGPFLSIEDALQGFLGVNLGPEASSAASAFAKNYGSFA